MYATLAEANEYVKSYHSSTDPLRSAWEGLSDEDRQVLLNRAEQIIDSLPLKGRPLESGKAFPREPFQEISMEKVKAATIEVALHGLDQEASERSRLQRQGVKSYKIGDLSETFRDSGVSGEAEVLSVVMPHLSNWLGGGYRICPTRIK